ncbi:hypothetical protein BDV93DRAFT_570896 [Ceratobasidium sp. AG-I]|nr:hypothetical protein BDV93DRAFT_570896 [Ceratobasidium sp. AG-I]
MSTHDNMNGDQNASRRRRFVEIITTLGSMGLTKELDLPQLACIGSQSVGKSSLIEALAGITLPRQSGTCTRCPIECRLRYTQEPWEARILLRIEPTVGNSTSAPSTTEIPFGAPIRDRELVGARIAQAQRAVLNPTIDPSKFLNDDYQPKGPSFTKSCVIVALSGSELSDLNFVDLPGLISTTSDKSTDGDIQLVEDLASGYISKSSVFILLVVSCQADFQTQGAVRLAREHDPDGKRTIGVLTKPDRIEQLEEGPWVSMLLGRENALANGWFCVKLPSSSDLRAKITPKDARAKEQKFFKGTAPWSGLVREHWGRLGTTNLGNRLGEILASEIQARLPAIRSEVDRLIRENDLNIMALPARGGGKPQAAVCRLIDGFVEDVKVKLIQGDAAAGQEGLIQTMNQLYDTLRLELQRAALVYKPCLPSGDLPRPEFLPDDEDWLSAPTSENEHSLEQIINLAKWARTREFHGDYPFAVKKQLIARAIEIWRQPVFSALATSESKFKDILSYRVQKHFQTYSFGGLRDAVRDIVMETLESCKFKTMEQLEFLLDQESEPNTVHEGLYRRYKNQFSGYYQDVFTPGYGLSKLGKILELGKEQLLQTALGPALEAAGLKEMNVEDLKRLLPLTEPDQNAIEIMASTSAHFQISYRRFSDNVPLTIDQHFIRGFGRHLRDALHDGLHITEQAPEVYFEELLRESESTVAYRRELLEKKTRLNAARMELL